MFHIFAVPRKERFRSYEGMSHQVGGVCLSGWSWCGRMGGVGVGGAGVMSVTLTRRGVGP